MKQFTMLLILVMIAAFFSCSSIPTQTEQGVVKESALTPGMTKKYITPMETTQAEVLEIFGPPDLVTRKDGKEMWTYDRISNEITQSGNNLLVFIFGGTHSKYEERNRSTMLIIYFDESDTVIDYRLNSVKF